MLPLDMRNATFADVKARLAGQRLQVLEAFRKYGPATTQVVAGLSGISILSLRPRSTELYQLGLLVAVGSEGHETIFRACSEFEARGVFEAAKRNALRTQTLLNI